MSAGRSSKRTNDAMESPSDSPSLGPKAKLPRLERGPEDFSSLVKSKLQSYTRTGQACDRCKVRKIRCDALPEGCSHCIQQNLECYVTDRVTGRTERRGYLQQLEREKNDMLTRIRDLERLLDDRGVHVRPWPSSPAYGSGAPSDLRDDGTSREQWTQFGSLWIKVLQHEPSSGFSAGQQPSPTPHQEARTVDVHLGVAKDNSPLSSINGTRLSILGATIDITSFNAPDMDGPPSGTPIGTPLYNKSLQSFYNSIAKVNPPIDVPVPSRDEAFRYSEWFFIMVGTFLPILHKPTYLRLLTRMYDDPTFKPSTADLVQVHMVFAIMYYQFGVRNGEDSERKTQLNDLSNKHYHWCVDKTWDLAADLSIASVQALVLIAIHCRGFPKPGPAFLMASLAWTRATEMNLHRAYVKKGDPTNLDNEMRKRTWWCIFMIVVLLYGRMGKPMPIRSEDFDVELPVCVPDECLTEDGINEQGRMGECQWLAGYISIKLSVLYMELWNNVYSVRQCPERYVGSVRRLEQKFRAFQDEIPAELQLDKCKLSNRAHAIYLEASSYEFLLCLRHPSRCVTNDPNFVVENNKGCEDAARNILKLAHELARLKSLDTTWYQMAVYVGAIFTVLAAHWERRFEITSAEIASLNTDMSLGMLVMNEASTYIGSESGLSTQISSIIDRTVACIERDMGSKHYNNTPVSPFSPQRLAGRPNKHEDFAPTTQRRPSHQSQRSAIGTPIPMTNGADQIPVHRTAGMGNASYYNSPIAAATSAYSQMGYPDLGQSAVPTSSTNASSISSSYIPTDESSQHPYLYATSAAASTTAAAQMVHNTQGNSPQPSQALSYGNQPPAPQHQQSGHSPGSAGGWMGGPGPGGDISTVQHVPNNGGNPWHEWTSAMMDPSSQDRYSANALLSMGSVQRNPGDTGTGDMGVVNGPDPGVAVSGMSAVHNNGQWPMLIFHNSTVSDS